jgi:hypothetical protein
MYGVARANRLVARDLRLAMALKFTDIPQQGADIGAIDTVSVRALSAEVIR